MRYYAISDNVSTILENLSHVLPAKMAKIDNDTDTPVDMPIQNSKYLSLYKFIRSINLTKQKPCSTIPPTVFLQFEHLTKWDVKILFNNPHGIAKKRWPSGLDWRFPVALS